MIRSFFLSFFLSDYEADESQPTIKLILVKRFGSKHLSQPEMLNSTVRPCSSDQTLCYSSEFAEIENDWTLRSKGTTYENDILIKREEKHIDDLAKDFFAMYSQHNSLKVAFIVSLFLSFFLSFFSFFLLCLILCFFFSIFLFFVKM